MAREIATYDAKDVALRPSNVGFSAVETAARRIGPLATQAAEAVKQVAALQASSEREAGQQQTAFARLQGLEQAQGGGGVKYKGGLKDMFQLGAGGREPNYDRLNRLSDLANGPVRIAQTARQIVSAQSPLTNTVQNGVTVLRGGSDQGRSDVENGVTVLRGGGGPPPAVPQYPGEATSVLGQPGPYQPPTEPNTTGTGWSNFGNPRPVTPVTGVNGDQWPTPLPANNGLFGTSFGADQSVNNTLPDNQEGQQIPMTPEGSFPTGNAPSDPSQNPSAPPIWGDFTGGF